MGNAFETGNDPVAGDDHLARDLGVASFIGFVETAIPETQTEGKHDRRPRREDEPSS